MQKLRAEHIEKAVREFIVELEHGPYFNVFFHPAETKLYEVLAETPEGALKIAQYHFFISGRKFQLVGAA